MQKSLLFAIIAVSTLVLLTPFVQAQILITTVQLDVGNQTLLAIGSNFGPSPDIFMGSDTGTLDQLNVTNSGANFVVADLLTTAAGTYVVLVANGATVGFADVTSRTPGCTRTARTHWTARTRWATRTTRTSRYTRTSGTRRASGG